MNAGVDTDVVETPGHTITELDVAVVSLTGEVVVGDGLVAMLVNVTVVVSITVVVIKVASSLVAVVTASAKSLALRLV